VVCDVRLRGIRSVDFDGERREGCGEFNGTEQLVLIGGRAGATDR
jgi:hypothetical protein